MWVCHLIIIIIEPSSWFWSLTLANKSTCNAHYQLSLESDGQCLRGCIADHLLLFWSHLLETEQTILYFHCSFSCDKGQCTRWMDTQWWQWLYLLTLSLCKQCIHSQEDVVSCNDAWWGLELCSLDHLHDELLGHLALVHWIVCEC